MKITQEVRDFAAQQREAAQDRPGDGPGHGLGTAAKLNSGEMLAAEEGMAAKAAEFREKGGEVYVAAG